MTNLNNQVHQELLSMKEIGIEVSDKALEKANTENLNEDYVCMSVSDIADMLTDLYN